MTNEAKRLRFYVTKKMALQMLCLRDDDYVLLQRIVKNNNIETFSVGATTFINRSDLEAADSPVGEVKWPPHLGTLDMNDFITSTQASEILGLTTRQVTGLANNYVIESYDLSHWGGHRMYSRTSVQQEANHRAVLARMLERKRTPKKDPIH